MNYLSCPWLVIFITIAGCPSVTRNMFDSKSECLATCAGSVTAVRPPSSLIPGEEAPTNGLPLRSKDRAENPVG